MAYGIWMGIAIVGASLFQVLYLNQPINLYKIIFMTFIITGIIGLKMTTFE
jgi:quaternary ammonium compound-resistance protein SugE